MITPSYIQKHAIMLLALFFSVVNFSSHVHPSHQYSELVNFKNELRRGIYFLKNQN